MILQDAVNQQAYTRRLELARQIAIGYLEHPHIAAVTIAGSVARGNADRYSDIELDVYWREPPGDDDRRALAERADATNITIWPYEDEEWSDRYFVDEIHIDLSQFLAATIDRWLIDVTEANDTSIDKHMRIAAIQHAIVLRGESLIDAWRIKAATYPDALQHALIHKHLDFDASWYAAGMLADRDDLVFLYDLYNRIAHDMLGTLAALNRVYLPHPRHKWMDHLIAHMPIAPESLSLRLKQVFRLAPRSGVRLMNELLEETLGLIEARLPQIDTQTARKLFTERRASH